jgi:hypothetical protein
LIKQTLTYKDLDGNDITEDFYFNLSVPEAVKLDGSFGEGGMEKKILELVTQKNGAEVISFFELVLTKSIGRRSEDNKRFVKKQDIIDEFTQSNAYEAFLIELLTDTQKSIDFINGVMPANIEELAAKVAAAQQAQQEQQTSDVPLPEVPAWIAENREPTQEEVKKMSPDQLREAFQRKVSK